MLEKVETVAIFKKYFYSWQLLGLTNSSNKYLYGFYDIVLSIGITILYPMHLTIGLFDSNNTQETIFKNLAINVTCIGCSIKQFFYRRKLQQMQEVSAMFAHLDQRIRYQEERDYFIFKLQPAAQRVLNVFLVFYATTLLSSFSGAAMLSQRHLLYPAWLPFDWRDSEFKYVCALGYQYVGLSMQVLQNFANDVFGPLSLCMLAGHVQLLSMRLRRVGYEECNPKELISCVEDWQQIMKIYGIVQDTISRGMFAQIIISGISICNVIICLLFYAEDVFDYIYFTFYWTCMMLEIFPCCYYASYIDVKFQEFPYAIFSCNWIEQDRSFRQNVFAFSCMSMRVLKMSAMGMIQINLETFIETCKMAYSLFALVMNVK